jgi:hypothetical protein
VVSIQCFDGCECRSTRIDAHNLDIVNSVFVEHPLRLRLGVRGDIQRACGLELVVLNLTSSGGHKFKLRSITVTAASSRSSKD